MASYRDVLEGVNFETTTGIMAASIFKRDEWNFVDIYLLLSMNGGFGRGFDTEAVARTVLEDRDTG